MENIRRFNRLRLAMPRAVRPRLTFNYVLMKSTIAEFPAFIDLAARFRADVVSCFHLLDYVPGSEGETLAEVRPLANHYLAHRARARAAARPRRRPPRAVRAVGRGEPRVPTAGRAAPGARSAGFSRGSTRMPRDASPGARIPRAGTIALPELPGQSRCHFLWRKTYIGPEGEVFTCCLANAVEIGNIRERPFQLIWNGPIYTDMRRRVYTANPHRAVQGLLRDREERIDLAFSLGGGGAAERGDHRGVGRSGPDRRL